MISTLSGSITALEYPSVTITLQGIGFQLLIPHSVTVALQQQVTLHVHLHWHPEQGPTLYGFATPLDKEIFLMIIQCSGVGPKLGLAILTAMNAATFLEVVQRGDQQALSAVHGIGAKKAEQLIIQLRDKVAKLLKSGIKIDESASVQQWHTVAETLGSLAYTRVEITHAMHHIRDLYGAQPSVAFDQLLRSALTFLAKRP